MAEYYRIYDYRSFEGRYIATLAAGLRPSSRTVMALAGQKASVNELQLARAVDELSIIRWFMSSDGKDGINRPKSLVSVLLEEKDIDAVRGFEEPAQYEAARQKITGGIKYA